MKNTWSGKQSDVVGKDRPSSLYMCAPRPQDFPSRVFLPLFPTAFPPFKLDEGLAKDKFRAPSFFLLDSPSLLEDKSVS
jgi:hypothetical protein